MELVVDRCSLCQTNDMVCAPHGGGALTRSVFMICPYCDTSSGELDAEGNGISRAVPKKAKQYDGVGPTRGRPEGTL